MRCGVFYHIYNRGINGEDLFKDERSFALFLNKFTKHVHPVAETYAYCLLKNHFHLLVRIRSASVVNHWYEHERQPHVGSVPRRHVGSVPDASDVSTGDASDVAIQLAEKRVSTQFANLFNAYTQTINKKHGRTGGLFEESFRRIPVHDEAYFVQLVYYIHRNPEKHGFVRDFRTYPHSSFHALISKRNTLLERNQVLKWFGDQAEFECYLLGNQILSDLDQFEIEYE
jgi:REP element-mobilizing transposase RayT